MIDGQFRSPWWIWAGRFSKAYWPMVAVLLVALIADQMWLAWSATGVIVFTVVASVGCAWIGYRVSRTERRRRFAANRLDRLREQRR